MGKTGKNSIGIRIGYASLGTESGDCAMSCRLPEGRRALILSDGMGRGAQAALASRPLARKLRQLLQEGMPAGKAISRVNRYLIEKGKGEDEESFATVDLAVIDESSGRANLYKMGAAPTFVVKGSRVRKVQRPALPAGIIDMARPAWASASLEPGDVIIMVSDGITDSSPEADDGWLSSLLKSYKPWPKPRQLAEEILSEAVKRYGNRESDDATVIVAVIYEMEKDDEETNFADHK